MRPSRLLLLALGGLVIACGVAVALAFSSSVQTWAVRRALAAHPEVRAAVGAVSVGLRHVEVRDLRWEQDGRVLSVPLLEAELPVLSVWWSRRAVVSHLRAQGWVVELGKSATSGPSPLPPGVAGAQAARASVPVGVTPPGGSTGPASALAVPTGWLSQVVLPVGLELDGVQLEGEVRLADAKGRVLVRISGGGFTSGAEGKLELVADAILTENGVSAVTSRAVISSRMDTERTFSRVDVKFETTARGTPFPTGVDVDGTMTIARTAVGETYTATINSHGRNLLKLESDYPQASRWRGSWRVNLQESELAALAHGFPLPKFNATGAGSFDCDPRAADFQVVGKLSASVERLESVRAQLSGLGPLAVEAEFDLGERAGLVEVRRFQAALAGPLPVGSVRALQPFTVRLAGGEIAVSDPERDLFAVSLVGVPLAWLQPWLTPNQVLGTSLRGELVGRMRGSGISLRSMSPVIVTGLTFLQGDKPVLEHLDLALALSADSTPEGWTAEVNGLTVSTAGVPVLTLTAKAGKLVGATEPVKAAGRLAVNLPAALGQPGFAGIAALSRGDLTVEFGASLGATQAWHAKLALLELETSGAGSVVRLPSFAADVRLDRAADGRIGFHAPLVFEAGDRKSDLLIEGSRAAGAGGAITATAASQVLHLDDLRAFASAVVAPAADRAAVAGKVAPPPWTGVSGSIGLRLQQVIYSDKFHVNNLTGRLALDAGKVRLEGVEAGVGQSGRAQVEGSLTFDAREPQPYTLAAEVAVRDFDPGPLLRSANGVQTPTVEGRFDLSSRLTSRAPSLEALADGTAGEFQLASKGGVFRGLPATVSTAAGTPGRVAGLISAAGQAIGGLAGRREEPLVASKAQAVAELASGLNAIAFDQLSVVLRREPEHRLALREFALIAPELRLSGAGTLLSRPGASLVDDVLAMEFTLRVRGRSGELVKYLGALDPTPDDLGYSACTVPIRISGTLGRPDASDFNVRLAALALEKGGVTERASELFNRLIGAGK